MKHDANFLLQRYAELAQLAKTTDWRSAKYIYQDEMRKIAKILLKNYGITIDK